MAFIVTDNTAPNTNQNDNTILGNVASTAASGNGPAQGSSASSGPTQIGPSASSGAPLGTVAAQSGGSSAGTSKIPGTTGVAGSSPETQGQKSSGNFVGLRDYLNVNNDQAGNLANNISSNISQGAQNAKSQLDNDTKQFNQQVQSNSFNYDPSFLNQVANDPSAVVNSTNSKGETGAQQFKDYLNASYNGPTSLDSTTNVGDIANQIQNSQNLAGLTNTEGGRQELLNKQYSTPTYSAGQQYLDQMLLENNPDTQNTFSALRNNLANYNSLIPTAETNAANSVGSAQNTAAYANQEAHNILGSNTPSANAATIATPASLQAPTALDNAANNGNTLYNQFTKNLTGYQNTLGNVKKYATDNYNQVQAALNNTANGGGMTPAELQALGFSPTQASNAFGAQLSGDVTAKTYNLANILTPQEYQQLQDLNTLLSAGNEDQNLNGLVDSSQVNTYSPTDLGFTANQPAISQAISAARDSYQKQFSNAMDTEAAKYGANPLWIQGQPYTDFGNPINLPTTTNGDPNSNIGQTEVPGMSNWSDPSQAVGYGAQAFQEGNPSAGVAWLQAAGLNQQQIQDFENAYTSAVQQFGGNDVLSPSGTPVVNPLTGNFSVPDQSASAIQNASNYAAKTGTTVTPALAQAIQTAVSNQAAASQTAGDSSSQIAAGLNNAATNAVLDAKALPTGVHTGTELSRPGNTVLGAAAPVQFAVNPTDKFTISNSLMPQVVKYAQQLGLSNPEINANADRFNAAMYNAVDTTLANGGSAADAQAAAMAAAQAELYANRA